MASKLMCSTQSGVARNFEQRMGEHKLQMPSNLFLAYISVTWQQFLFCFTKRQNFKGGGAWHNAPPLSTLLHGFIACCTSTITCRVWSALFLYSCCFQYARVFCSYALMLQRRRKKRIFCDELIF